MEKRQARDRLDRTAVDGYLRPRQLVGQHGEVVVEARACDCRQGVLELDGADVAGRGRGDRYVADGHVDVARDVAEGEIGDDAILQRRVVVEIRGAQIHGCVHEARRRREARVDERRGQPALVEYPDGHGRGVVGVAFEDRDQHRLVGNDP